MVILGRLPFQVSERWFGWFGRGSKGSGGRTGERENGRRENVDQVAKGRVAGGRLLSHDDVPAQLHSSEIGPQRQFLDQISSVCAQCVWSVCAVAILSPVS